MIVYAEIIAKESIRTRRHSPWQSGCSILWHLLLAAMVISCTASHPYRAEMQRLKHRIAEDPADMQAVLELGEIHYLIGEYGDALDCFETAEQLAPEDPTVLYHKGQALLALGRCEDGHAAALDAERLNPDDENIQLLKGMSLFCLYAVPEAQRVFAAIVARNPDNAMAVYFLGRCLLTQGDREAALRQYNHLKLLDAALAEKLFVAF